MTEKKREYNPRVETRLRKADFQRLDDLAKLEGASKSQVVRDAVLWYLKHKDEVRAKPREAEIASAIGEMTNRICGMLARQGASIGTLYELTWMNLPNEEARKSFHTAATTAKQKMRNRLEKDEKDLAEKIKGAVAPW